MFYFVIQYFYFSKLYNIKYPKSAGWSLCILMWDVIILVIKYADQWKHYDVVYVYHMKILSPSDLKFLNCCRTSIINDNYEQLCKPLSWLEYANAKFNEDHRSNTEDVEGIGSVEGKLPHFSPRDLKTMRGGSLTISWVM